MPTPLAIEREWVEAAQNGDDERVAELLAQYPDLPAAGSFQRMTALDRAAESGHENVVARLLAANSFMSGYPGGMTPLHHAVTGGHDKVVALLLAARPNLVSKTTTRGMTALHYAADRGHEHIFHQLLAVCPELIDAVDNSHTTVLLCAVRHEHESLVAQILALRPEMIDATDRKGWNALHVAVFWGHQRIAERLIAAKPELVLALPDVGEETILHTAIENCDKNFIVRLWRMNPQALHVSADTYTPFHLAIEQGRLDLVEAFQWSLSFDEIVSAYTRVQRDYEERYRPVMERLCEEPLLDKLNQDVVGTVFEYLGFDRVFKMSCFLTMHDSPQLNLDLAPPLLFHTHN